jgi:hypothetical protein
MYKPSGVGPIEVWTEQVRANGNLYGVGVSDDFATTALFNGSPARPGHVKDQVNYATSPVETDWTTRRRGAVSPASAKSGNGASKNDGSLT